MSQKDPKRPGSRDISELKARLGLKKGAAGATGPQPKPNGSGVVPPPGLNLPPPPGAKPPGPVIPSASDDPFGAMNAIAQYGASQRAPEIVIVNDGKPVEQVSPSKRLQNIAIPAALAVGGLILGIVFAGIGKDAHNNNDGIDSAAALAKVVDSDTKVIGTIKAAFDASNGLKDRKDQEEVTKALSAAKDKLLEHRALALSARTDFLGKDLRPVFSQFYAMVDELNDMITDHEATASMEEAAIKTGADQVAKLAIKDGDTLSKAGEDYKYKLGLLLSNPSDESDKTPQGARLVEIGAPLCGPELSSAKPSDTGSCPKDSPVSGFLYRTDGNDVAWSKGKVMPPGSLKGGAAFPLGQIILLNSSQTLDSLVKGPDGTYAEAAYFKRLAAIYDKVKKVYDLGEQLQTALDKRGKASKSFTFFM